ncbi:MAG: UDP-2,4-diacetamido-2,4,6-trideoxy-beta-L-altropyranose hydrolase [Erythrobacter sp.]|nr:UDP-2,4-diacetamido-2,4,6-trideoxy-beta-L-altropyranose hydrolase [Erythrobacter sp.]|tara:strand:- start:1637 stop:2749 length:1113 start_codon:yes stop_codon:yes gene_type:complete
MIDTASTPPLIAFRTDASLEIGTGHVMRCLTLADRLRECGARTLFISRKHCGHLFDQIVDRGHEVRVLPPPPNSRTTLDGDTAHAAWLGVEWGVDAEQTQQSLAGERPAWLVVDHYAIDCRWERALRSACERLMVMDDLADRPHDCELLLDPTLGRTHGDYADHLGSEVQTFLGPQYALLRPEFAASRAESLARRNAPELRHVLITMGGVDKDNATGRVLDAIEASDLPSQMKLTVVMGSQAPWFAKVQDYARKMRFATHVRVGVTDMARLMTKSDLAIGAAGGTSWERCCLGLPTIQYVVAENQLVIARQLAQIGAATLADDETIREVLSSLVAQDCSTQLAEQSGISSRVTDGLGAERVANELLGRLQ